MNNFNPQKFLSMLVFGLFLLLVKSCVGLNEQEIAARLFVDDLAGLDFLGCEAVQPSRFIISVECTDTQPYEIIGIEMLTSIKAGKIDFFHLRKLTSLQRLVIRSSSFGSVTTLPTTMPEEFW